MADMQKYCAEARGDENKMGECMRAHHDQFSTECRAQIDARKQAQQAEHAPQSEQTNQGGKKPKPPGSPHG
jgi:hypothetical protein